MINDFKVRGDKNHVDENVSEHGMPSNASILNKRSRKHALSTAAFLAVWIFPVNCSTLIVSFVTKTYTDSRSTNTIPNTCIPLTPILLQMVRPPWPLEKSGLNFPTLKIFIHFLSKKAVLVSRALRFYLLAYHHNGCYKARILSLKICQNWFLTILHTFLDLRIPISPTATAVHSLCRFTPCKTY